MSGKRPPAPPPALAGFTYVDVLGSGGFADVYLYEQHLPRRRVAVKVMLAERMGSDAIENFAAEANVMALMSTHPAIVTIYQAGVADDGRPYLVMEYCSRPNLQVRSRSQTFSVAEALRVGVQVAAAVETAHRAGILHRDIKPANILVTDYNRPALTDFGIATSADAGDPAGGMSIPWSPPEAFREDAAAAVTTDVYALGATVYTLLAGRSPFEQPGGRNGGADLIQRIETHPLAPIDRADIPASLQAVLERAMAKRPGDRHESAVAFARALQRVQIELAHSVTPIDILDDAPVQDDPEEADGELTRVRGIVSIAPHTSPAAGTTRQRDEQTISSDTVASARRAVETTTADPTRLRGPVSIAPIDDAPVAETPLAPTAAPVHRSRRGWWIGGAVAVGAVAVIAAIATVASVLGGGAPRGGDGGSGPESPASVRPQDPLGDVVPRVGALTGAVAGTDVVFTWTNPDPEPGDAYLWYPYTLSGSGDTVRVTDPTVTVPQDAGGTTCIAVTLVRSSGAAGGDVRGCVP